ncbi:hypothetical protein HPP92_003596 [Vanilla planifolia]|uniref:K Homology domain-containing protein n=1 Tax=Vanilla planifolia TaxID=51239 RepID=A0A835S3H9_VANPL|nr:hypothetical protein HPP92_003596 [Vanilla planifolia]
MADELKYSRSDNKRKFDDDGGAISPSPAAPTSGRRPTGFSAPIVSPSTSASLVSSNSVPPPPDGIELAKQRAQEIAARIFSDAEAKRPRVENGGSGEESGNRGFGSDLSLKSMGQSVVSQHGVNAPSNSYGFPGSSKRIDIPNGRVGVIIGKSGETIKYLQVQSGARIQVTRDMDADPSGQTRPVELIGTPEQISKAEQLINEVLSEADAGGSGIIAARKFSAVPSGSEHFSMKVPNNKVGLIIGKGGETIKNMQATSGARIQVIPLHLPPGDNSLERTVHIDGTREQIELAKQLVNDVTSENRGRNTQMGGGYRPPRPPSAWVPPAAPHMQQPGYGYMQPGPYPAPPPQYNAAQPPYGGYPPPISTGWDSSNPPAPQTTQATGYDYSQQQTQHQPTTGSTASTDVNAYNYNQMPPAYNLQAQYAESAYSQSPAAYQQSYGAPGGYSQVGAQSGYALPTSNAPSAYPQQGYGPPSAYSNAAATTQEGSALTYGVQSSSTQQASQPAYGSQPSGPTEYLQPAAVAQPGYGQPSQGQKPPQAQSGYVQPGQGYGQAYAPLPNTQPGYSQDPQRLAGGYGASAPQAGYAQPQSYVPAQQNQATGYVSQQQLQQPYGDAYSGGAYPQPSYPPESTHGSHDATPVATSAASGGAKASSQS